LIWTVERQSLHTKPNRWPSSGQSQTKGVGSHARWLECGQSGRSAPGPPAVWPAQAQCGRRRTPAAGVEPSSRRPLFGAGSNRSGAADSLPPPVVAGPATLERAPWRAERPPFKSPGRRAAPGCSRQRLPFGWRRNRPVDTERGFARAASCRAKIAVGVWFASDDRHRSPRRTGRQARWRAQRRPLSRCRVVRRARPAAGVG